MLAQIAQHNHYMLVFVRNRSSRLRDFLWRTCNYFQHRRMFVNTSVLHTLRIFASFIFSRAIRIFSACSLALCSSCNSNDYNNFLVKKYQSSFCPYINYAFFPQTQWNLYNHTTYVILINRAFFSTTDFTVGCQNTCVSFTKHFEFTTSKPQTSYNSTTCIWFFT